MACGSPIAPNASHAAQRTSQSSSCRAWMRGGWLAGRLSDPTPHTPPREPHLISLILQGLDEVGNRVPSQRLQRR
jgi:hypothetical protein